MAKQTGKHFSFGCAELGAEGVYDALGTVRDAHTVVKTPRLGGFAGTTRALWVSAAIAVLSFAASVTAVPTAAQEPQAKTKARATTTHVKVSAIEQQRETWRKSIVKKPRPKKGCFTATFPETEWREVACGTAPNRPYGPRNGVRPQVVGNGSDFSGQVTANTTTAEGSFDSVAGVTGENDGGNANVFSLQLNTNTFTTSACNASPVPASCRGWEQFIYSNSGAAFIQYWMLNFGPGGTACPAGWNSFSFTGQTEVFCFTNSAHAAAVPVQTIASLGQMKLDGLVGDSVSLTIGATVFSATGDDHFPDLTNGWRLSEFNVFGDFNGTQAAFNNGSTIVVRTAMDSGTPAVPPTCSQQGFTGETNNLTLVSAPTMAPDVVLPSIIFTESNAPNPTPVSCATADHRRYPYQDF